MNPNPSIPPYHLPVQLDYYAPIPFAFGGTHEHCDYFFFLLENCLSLQCTSQCHESLMLS